MKTRPAFRRYTPIRLFDKFHPRWNNYDRKQNAIFVGLVLGELNDLLRDRGVVTLNEALERLSFGRTKDDEGDTEGWVYEPDPNIGDGYISFGIWDHGFANGLDWINGKSDIFAMRFNVDRLPLALSLRAKEEWEMM